MGFRRMSAESFYHPNGTVYANRLGNDEERFDFCVELESNLLCARIWVTTEHAVAMRDALDAAIAHRQAMQEAA